MYVIPATLVRVLFTLCACASGKVIGCVVIIVVVVAILDTKIAKSGELGT